MVIYCTFILRYNIPLEEEREVALKRLKAICDAGFISVLNFKDNPRKIFAAHELAAIVDSAMATKMTVQFNLFGKSADLASPECYLISVSRVRL